jgi:hypothetical protein
VDEWSPTMWWGDKEDEKPIGHAGESIKLSFFFSNTPLTCSYVGTSNVQLPPVRMNTWYAGTRGVELIDGKLFLRSLHKQAMISNYGIKLCR